MITFIGVLVGALLVTSYSHFFLFAALGPALITLGAFALNDYFGYKTDKANKRKDRPIVSGAISKQQALYASIILFVSGLALTFFVNLTVFFLSLLYVGLSILYDSFLKKLPLLGNVFIGLTMAGPFIYGNLTVSTQLSPVVLLLSAIAFLVGIGRELLNTLRDVEGDAKIGAKTLPMLLGAKKTAFLASLFILTAVALTFIPFSNAPFSYAFLVIFADLLLLLTVYKVIKNQDVNTLKQCRNYTLLALLLGVLAFLALAVLK